MTDTHVWIWKNSVELGLNDLEKNDLKAVLYYEKFLGIQLPCVCPISRHFATGTILYR